MAKLNKSQLSAMLVSKSEIPVAKRGRKATTIENLTEVLELVTPEQGANLGPIFGPAEDQAAKQRISQQIRTHWVRVHADTKPSISWAADGTPFVQVGKAVEVTA